MEKNGSIIWIPFFRHFLDVFQALAGPFQVPKVYSRALKTLRFVKKFVKKSFSIFEFEALNRSEPAELANTCHQVISIEDPMKIHIEDLL